MWQELQKTLRSHLKVTVALNSLADLNQQQIGDISHSQFFSLG